MKIKTKPRKKPTKKQNPFGSAFYFCRDDWIRTSDPLHPMQVRYQAALHPVSTLQK